MQEKTVQPQDAQNARKEGEKSAQTAEGEKTLETRLTEAQAKIEQQRDTMMRAMADAENARKRAQAEAATAQKYALERFADGLLPVVDSLEAALKSGDTSGIELTLKQLQAALEKAGVQQINPAPGERFDPHRHHAVAAVEVNAAQSVPNTIVAVM